MLIVFATSGVDGKDVTELLFSFHSIRLIVFATVD